MKVVSTDVKSKQEVVGVAEFEVFDSVLEATDFLGETTTLSIINAQHRTNKMNVVRAAATGAPSKKALQVQALSIIPIEELQKVHGDPAALQVLLNTYVDKLLDDLNNAKEGEVEVES